MKKVIAFLFLAILVPVSAWPSPFVVSDPYPASGVQPDGFAVSVDGGAVVEYPAQAVTGGVRMYFDIGGLPAGSHTITVRAYKNYQEPWTRKESDPVNFTFTVPAAPSAPAGIGLIR